MNSIKVDAMNTKTSILHPFKNIFARLSPHNDNRNNMPCNGKRSVIEWHDYKCPDLVPAKNGYHMFVCQDKHRTFTRMAKYYKELNGQHNVILGIPDDCHILAWAEMPKYEA